MTRNPFFSLTIVTAPFSILPEDLLEPVVEDGCSKLHFEKM